jgi:hypothetical protein
MASMEDNPYLGIDFNFSTSFNLIAQLDLALNVLITKTQVE